MAKAPFFDNLNDVTSKFQGTMCYYENKACLVKSVGPGNDEHDFTLAILPSTSNRSKLIHLNDPDFRYKDYNLGYANGGHYAVWWCRKPAKQYKQGLKGDQMMMVCSQIFADHHGFQWCAPISRMLENTYPTREQAAQAIRDEVVGISAFHRDFAVSWDHMHDDYILEYRGKKIGTSHNLQKFQLRPDFKHLTETLEEVMANVQ